MQRLLGLMLGLSILLPFTSGCESRIPKKELGKVVFEVPELSDNRQPFKVPGIDYPKEGGEKEEPTAIRD